MADTLSRVGPLLADVPFAVTPLPPMTRLSARGGPEAARRIGDVFGVGLPQTAMRANEAGARAALWLGPDEWLLLAPEDEGLRKALEGALSGEPGCVVDVSHRQIGLELVGSAVSAVLNVGCPLDLDLSAFPVGMCTRTILGKAEIVLWRHSVDRFHVECWRSFAPYAHALLRQAAADDAA